MNFVKGSLPPGLYLVSTPIGNARDITLRALDVLASAEVLAAEDTRTLRKLMDIHGIPLGGRRLIAYHDHSRPKDREALFAEVAAGRSVAYASEAGTPLIADPGYHLVAGAAAKGLTITPIPGPSAAVAAMSVSGLPTDRFLFVGFVPNSQAARRRALEDVKDVDASLIFYEAPGRVAAFFQDATDVMGADRDALLCREITKRFEELKRGTLSELAAALRDVRVKGECVVVLGKPLVAAVDDAEIDARLRDLLADMRLKEAVEAVSQAFELPRRDIYQRALAIKEENR
ncbi:MAG: 16S rRNA (cytidine(1402)-2'-O)-methyltransferase [Pseudomonadota bacterium]